MCDFCIEFQTSNEGESRIILRDDLWVVLPTRGCFVAGYTLLLPIDHATSFATLPATDLAEAENLIMRVRGAIERQFGPTIVAEHGSSACDRGASCCDHAHIHLIPISDQNAVLSAYTSAGGRPLRLSRFSDITAFAGVPYQYLSRYPDEHLLWVGGSFSRQFVRRVVADLEGCADKYDWREHAFTQNMRATRAALTGLLGPAPDAGRRIA